MSRFILSKEIVLKQYSKLAKLGLTISYSTKTNPDITPILEENTTCFFGMHNIRNLKIVKDKSRVWFFPQGWNNENIEELIKSGVNKFVLDNENDLNVLLEYLECNDISIDLMLRMKQREHTIFTGRYYVFGMPSKQINRLIPKLAKTKGIHKLGVHFHRKTQNVSEWRLKEELEQSLTEETMNSISIVDIGGGFPSDYKNTSDNIMIQVEQHIKQLIEWLGDKEVIAEPGRFIAAPAGKFETRIVNIHDNNIIVDGSVYNGSMDTIVVPIKLRVEGELEEGTSYLIKGITPCSMDIFRYKVYLKEPKIGAKIVFLNAGAYNYSTNFCNLEKPEVILH